MNRSAVPYAILFVGVLIASTASIMITGAINLGISPIAIAAGRISLAALILTPLAWAKAGPELRRVSRRDLGLAMIAGICLAAHFASWISSLAYTSVASSTALVTTNPVFVALATWLIFRERLTVGTWVGVLLTVVGSALIGLSDRSGAGAAPLLGDGLALLGAVTVSGYFLLGRLLRARMSLLPYIWLVYTTAAVVLLVANVFIGQSLLGLPPVGYLLILGLALGPQLLGHTAFNWAIKYLSPTLVTVAILGEPIGSAAMALLMFQQPLLPLQLAGGAVLLLGIAVAILAEHRRSPRPAPALDRTAPVGG
ncbi:DMT family transporter [Chloroflexales bacterium ZM16-3]|nr:DMT family transporter [Chloroflexales bacterium ZM16-3]